MTLAIRGFGLGPVAYGPNDDIYVASAIYGSNSIPATAGAFQATHDDRACAGSGWLGIGCSYQALSSISADGKTLRYSTFVTGGYGAIPSGLAIDSIGDAIIAGTTTPPTIRLRRGLTRPATLPRPLIRR